MNRSNNLADISELNNFTSKVCLKKHVATIHCSNQLSLLQRKISNILLYNAYDYLHCQEEYVIETRELCQLLNYNSNDYKTLKAAFKSLLTTVIEWNVVDEATCDESWTASTVLASIRLDRLQCKYAYSPRMRELLHSPSVYAKINLDIQSRFCSSYGLALYENCVRYKSWLDYTRWFTLDVFRKLMGVGDGNYRVFRDFKKRVLDKAIDEVNSHSDILIVAEIERVGHKVSRLRFKVLEKSINSKKILEQTNNVSDGSERPPTDVELKKFLTEKINLSTKQCNQLFQQYAVEIIKEKLNLLLACDSYKSGLIKNICAYFLSSLKYDYKVPKSCVSNIQEKREQLENENKLKCFHDDILKQEYLQYISKKIDEAIGMLTRDELNNFNKMFDDYINKVTFKFIKDEYKAHGIQSKLVRSFYNDYFRENYLEKLNILSIEAFQAERKK